MDRLLPYPVFALILATFQQLAKPLGFAMAVVTSLAGFGVGGIWYGRVVEESRWPRPLLALGAAAVTWTSLTYVVLPVIQGEVLGVPLTTVVAAPALPMAIGSLLYGLVLATLIRPEQSRIRRKRPDLSLETAVAWKGTSVSPRSSCWWPRPRPASTSGQMPREPGWRPRRPGPPPRPLRRSA
jgi:hypothetical protein